MRKLIVCIAIFAIATVGLSPLVQAGDRDRLARTNTAVEARSMTGPVSMHRLFIERAQWLLRLAGAENPYTTQGLADDADPVGAKENGGDDSDGNHDESGPETNDQNNGQPMSWHEVPTSRN